MLPALVFVLLIGFREIADVGAVAVIVVALLLIPYSLAALLVYEEVTLWLPGKGRIVLKQGDPRIKRVHRERGARFWPSLYVTTRMTKWCLVGMVFIMAIVLLRLGLQYDQVGEATPQPAWSLALNLFASMVLLSILAQPPFALFWVKSQILGIHYGARETSEKGDEK